MPAELRSGILARSIKTRTKPHIRYDAAYVQDSWRVGPKLTVEMGLRYDYYQPYRESAGLMANFVPTSMTFNSATGTSTGTGIYKIPMQSQNMPLCPAFV